MNYCKLIQKYILSTSVFFQVEQIILLLAVLLDPSMNTYYNYNNDSNQDQYNIVVTFSRLTSSTTAPSDPSWTPTPKTDTLLTLSRTVREKGEMKIFKETELAQVSAKQYLDRVENTTRKAVFSESCFKVRASFCPIFSMNIKRY